VGRKLQNEGDSWLLAGNLYEVRDAVHISL
jgi:hypothetical protein